MREASAAGWVAVEGVGWVLESMEAAQEVLAVRAGLEAGGKEAVATAEAVALVDRREEVGCSRQGARAGEVAVALAGDPEAPAAMVAWAEVKARGRAS